MLKWIDESPRLARTIENLSATLARQRGLPIVLGVFLVIVSFVIDLVGLALPSPLLDLAWSITHHLGLVLALIGLLLVEPLGQ